MPSYNWSNISKSKKNFDQYPALRKRSLSRDTRGLSRRARVINEAQLRAVRRWDTYAARVRENKLDGKESAKLHEWRLIIQNGRLIRRLRWLADDVPERSDRVTYGLDPIQLPQVRPRRTTRKQEPAGLVTRTPARMPRVQFP